MSDNDEEKTNADEQNNEENTRDTGEKDVAAGTNFGNNSGG